MNTSSQQKYYFNTDLCGVGIYMCVHIKVGDLLLAYDALCRYTLFVHISVHNKLLYIAHLSTKKMALFVEKNCFYYYETKHSVSYLKAEKSFNFNA